MKIGPSALPWSKGWLVPEEMSRQQIQRLVKAFAEAAVRADKVFFSEEYSACGCLCR